tara:strand:+ start:2801 stop:3706 length:906 start_codon:yes stop_codon:yes gene_type:complete
MIFLKIYYIYIILLLNIIYGNASYLVLNQFEYPIPEIKQSLVNNFSNSFFQFDSSAEHLLKDIDLDQDSGFQYMNEIKEIGKNYNVNYILLNRIKENNDRLIIDGMLFNTRSGGISQRRKINVKNYDNGLTNELKLWMGNAISKVEKEWEAERKAILYLDPEDITYDKTPMGAALRSLVLPGWGQAYSGNYISAGIWAGLELSLALAFAISYNNYDTSAKSYLSNQTLYHSSNDEQEVKNYRNAAEKDWENHVLYSKVAIILASTTVTGWLSNSIYAWAFGPRPQANIYKQGIPEAPSPAG